MNKRFFLYLLVFLCFFSGCNTPTSDIPSSSNSLPSDIDSQQINNGTIEGDYIYRKVATPEGHYLLLKYNIKTGDVIPVCQDPFCSHMDSRCPFFIQNTASVVYIGNTVYYETVNDDQKEVICAYDAETMRSSYVFSTDKHIENFFAYGYDLYIEITYQNQNENMIREYCKLNTTTDKTSEIPCEKDAYIYEIKNQKITWQKRDSYYTTDLNGQNKKSLQGLNEQFGYTYRTEVVVEGPVSFRNLLLNMYRKNKNGGEETLVASRIGPSTFYRDKIIYFVPLPLEEQELVYSNKDTEIYDCYGGNVYIMDADGSNAKLLCHAESCYISGMSPDRNNEWYCGDWVGIALQDVTPDPETGVVFPADMLIVNTVTGEYVVCRYEFE